MCSWWWAGLKTAAMLKHISFWTPSFWCDCKAERKQTVVLGRFHWLKPAFFTVVCCHLLLFWISAQASLWYCCVTEDCCISSLYEIAMKISQVSLMCSVYPQSGLSLWVCQDAHEQVKKGELLCFKQLESCAQAKPWVDRRPQTACLGV